jgi:hypothetical protein
MKVWMGFGSEHSMNLVMIGRFREPVHAESAKRLIEALIQLAMKESEGTSSSHGPEYQRFSEDVLRLLSESELHSLAPGEIEQFQYPASLKVKGSILTLKSDEVDVSAFLKVMLDRGAKVEIFSAHEYPELDK